MSAWSIPQTPPLPTNTGSSLADIMSEQLALKIDTEDIDADFKLAAQLQQQENEFAGIANAPTSSDEKSETQTDTQTATASTETPENNGPSEMTDEDFALALQLQEEENIRAVDEYNTKLAKSRHESMGKVFVRPRAPFNAIAGLQIVGETHQEYAGDMDEEEEGYDDEYDPAPKTRGPFWPVRDKSLKGQGGNKEIITKHDMERNGRKNVHKMSKHLPSSTQTGDLGILSGAGRNNKLKVHHKVFNSFKHQIKKQDNSSKGLGSTVEKDTKQTYSKGLDHATRLIIHRMVNSGILDEVHGVIRTGKEAIVYHALGPSVIPEDSLGISPGIKKQKKKEQDIHTNEEDFETVESDDVPIGEESFECISLTPTASGTDNVTENDSIDSPSHACNESSIENEFELLEKDEFTSRSVKFLDTVKEGIIDPENVTVLSSSNEPLVEEDLESEPPSVIVPPGTREFAIKVFRTTLDGFKSRTDYIEGDHRFASYGKLKRQNPRKIVKVWSEKEFKNLTRIYRAGIPSPQPWRLHDNVLIMEFIGHDGWPAPQLREVKNLSERRLTKCFLQIVLMMRMMFQDCKLVHADLSEFNILYFKGSCFVIDVGQSVDRYHPDAETHLQRDCGQIIRFFKTRGVRNLCTTEELLNLIVSDEISSPSEIKNMYLYGYATEQLTWAKEHLNVAAQVANHFVA